MLPYAMALVAEFFIICHGLISFWTILSGRFNPRDFSFHNAQNGLFGKRTKAKVKERELAHTASTLRTLKPRIHETIVTIDVFVTACGEPISVLRQTVSAARNMYGAHMTHILDDGKSDEVRALAKQLGVKYIRRSGNEHAKAGNINHGLSLTTGEFFVIFDADFVADARFLYETLPFFDDENVAFVQTPQYYDNQHNFVTTAAGFMQHVFYSLVQSGKNRFNAAFCVGTNVVFRRSAIETIGGMYRYSMSEDIWTSLLLHEQGFRSVYINKVLAIGKTPETIKAYSKQQLRWATGSYELLLHHNPLRSRQLTVDQRLQYFGTATFYLNGFAAAVLLMLPALQIFFNLTPISVNIPLWQWSLLYSGFYVSQIFLSIYTMGGFKIETLTLASATFPVYIKAFCNALRRRNIAWEATNSIDSNDSPFNYIRAQTYLFLFMALTTIVGIWKETYTDQFSISLVWCAFNTLLLGGFIFVAVAEGRQMRQVARKARSLQLATVTGVSH